MEKLLESQGLWLLYRKVEIVDDFLFVFCVYAMLTSGEFTMIYQDCKDLNVVSKLQYWG